MVMDRTLDKTVGKLIENRRKERGITQKKLASQVGITPMYYRDITKGIHRPTWIIFVNICNALSIDINDLVKEVCTD